MRKRVLILITTTLLMFSLLTISVSADMFPKKTLNINITYVKDANLEAELLVKRDNFGEINRDFEERFTEEFIDFLETLDYNGYKSASLYHGPPFGIFLDEIDKDLYKFRFTYMYPKTFRLLIRDIDTNEVYISDEVTQKYFNSKMTVKIDKLSDEVYDEITIIDYSFKVKENYKVFENSYKLLLRIILTVLIEITILTFFLYKDKKSYKIVSVTNVITQVILNCLLMLSFLFQGIFMYFFILILAEIIVIGLESIIYLKYIDEKNKGITLLYTMLANIATIAVSFIPFLQF